MSDNAAPGPVIAIALLVAVVVFIGVRSCGDETTTTAAPTAKPEPRRPPPMMSVPPLQPASPLGGRSKPRLSKTTMKRYRVETCAFGSLGVPYAREAYWESLGPELPSSLNVPSFGDYPEHKPRKPGGRLPVAATIGRLPFESHLRACSAAKNLKGDDEYGGLAPALEAFDAYVTPLTRMLSDAARYYAREEYKRDKFKKAAELHQKLSDELPSFEEHQARYANAVTRWVATLGPAKEESELDAAGKLAKRAVAAARKAATATLYGPRDDDAVTALKKAAAALGAVDDDKAKHPRIVGPKLDALIAALDSVSSDKPGSAARYRIGFAMAELLNAEQRALSQLLAGDDDPFGARLRPPPAVSTRR